MKAGNEMPVGSRAERYKRLIPGLAFLLLKIHRVKDPNIASYYC